LTSRRYTHQFAALALLLLVFCAGCTSAPGAPAASDRPDALVAVNARSAIDGADLLRVQTLHWAGRAQAEGDIDQRRVDEIDRACQVLLDLSLEANGVLTEYLNSGSAGAREALRAALEKLAINSALLRAMKGADSGTGAKGGE
jgi:hypothetical protein